MTFNYVLIDTSQRMRFNQTLELWGASYVSLFQGHAEESLLDIAPLLIDVSDDNEKSQRVINEATRIGKIKPCVSFIGSALCLQNLGDHLRQFHMVSMSRRGSMVLRWYDTRILPAWISALHENQHDFFLRHIFSWRFLDRFGESKELTIKAAMGLAPIHMEIPLILDKEQGDSMWLASEPDQMINRLRKTIPHYIECIPSRVLYPFVSEQLDAAHKHGLSEQDDLSLYLLLGLGSSGHFVNHPIVIKRMAFPAHVQEQSFEAWFEELPDDVTSLGEPLWEVYSGENNKNEENEKSSTR